MNGQDCLRKLFDKEGPAMKEGFALFAALLLVLTLTANSLACTALYAGQAVTDDGTILIAKSND